MSELKPYLSTPMGVMIIGYSHDWREKDFANGKGKYVCLTCKMECIGTENMRTTRCTPKWELENWHPQHDAHIKAWNTRHKGSEEDG